MQNTQHQLRYALSEKISRLRQELQQLVKDKKGKLLDPDVIRFSQEIDDLIVTYQKIFNNFHRRI